MAKKAKTIEEALALFASGKSPRECEKLTGIPATTIRRHAKERGIIKGAVEQLIKDTVRVKADFGAQNGAVQELIQNEVNKQLEGMMFYSTNARKVLKMGLKAFAQDPSEQGMKTVLEGMKTGMQVEGLVPFYPSATINNVMARALKRKGGHVSTATSNVPF